MRRKSSEAEDRAVQVLVAEFQFVSGLIPFYRRAELVVLGATGALLSVMVAALATLEAADEGQRQAEGLLLALGAWVPVLLLLVEVMALARITRASRYIERVLRPRACALGQAKLLEFERSPSAELLPETSGWLARVRRTFTIAVFSSASLILVVAIASTALAVAGMIRDWSSLTLCFGAPAVLSALGLGAYGISFTWTHEARKSAR